jgi:nitric oxide synthase-interacting protein
MDGNKATRLPSFWVPSLTPAAKKSELKRPDQHVYCPISGKPITMKDLIDVKFKLANDVDPNKRPLVAVRDRYVCAVTGDLLGNSVPCAVLRTSGNVVTMDCVNRLIKLDMVDPITGAKLTDDDIIPMQRGGTGKKFINFKNIKLNFYFSLRIFWIWSTIRCEITNTCDAVIVVLCVNEFMYFSSFFFQ